VRSLEPCPASGGERDEDAPHPAEGTGRVVRVPLERVVRLRFFGWFLTDRKRAKRVGTVARPVVNRRGRKLL
jgi:hypothetical protein